MAKILKNIYFRPHLREGKFVSGYQKIVPIDPEKNIPHWGDMQNAVKEVSEALEENNVEKVEQGILKLYKMGKRHFCDEPALNGTGLLTQCIESINETGWGEYIKDSTTFYKKIVSDNYVSNLYNRSVELERIFKNTIDSKIERINNFVFRFWQETSYNESGDEIAQIINEKMFKQFRQSISKRNDKLKELFADFTSFEPDFFKNLVLFIREQKTTKKQFTSKIGPILLLRTLFNKRFADSGLIQPIKRTHINEIQEFFISNGWNISSDPSKWLGNIKTQFGEEHPVVSILSKLPKGKVLPTLDYIGKHGCIPIFYTDLDENDAIHKTIHTFSLILWDIVDPRKTKHKRLVYVSVNPLDFLSASHDGYLDTCIALTKDGNVNVNEHNINIPQTYYLDEIGDFIVYIGNERPKNGLYKKTARIFLTLLDDEKITNFDHWKVYGQDERDLTFIKKLLQYMDSKQMLVDPQKVEQNVLNITNTHTQMISNSKIVPDIQFRLDVIKEGVRNGKIKDIGRLKSIAKNLIEEDTIEKVTMKELKREIPTLVSKAKTFTYESPIHKIHRQDDSVMRNIKSVTNKIKYKIYKEFEHVVSGLGENDNG